MSRITLTAAFVLAFSVTCAAQAMDEQILYAFTGLQDGAEPSGTLLKDATGNLYGGTAHGGTYDGGVVFRLTPDGTETVLHSFSGGSDGGGPYGGVIWDKAGNFYGASN